MEIKCENCKTKFNLPEDKLDIIRKKGLDAFPCPKCKQKISLKPDGPPKAVAPALKPGATVKPPVKTPAKAPDPAPEASLEDSFGFSEEEDAAPFTSDSKTGSEKMFDFTEEEGDTVLICETDPQIVDRMKKVLEFMEYTVKTAATSPEALRNLRYQNYTMVIVNEAFDTKNIETNNILIYLQRLNMDIRRNMFVILLSQRYKTMDYMRAFQKSVNFIFNPASIDDFERILKRGLAENDMSYRVFKDTLKKLGRI